MDPIFDHTTYPKRKKAYLTLSPETNYYILPKFAVGHIFLDQHESERFSKFTSDILDTGQLKVMKFHETCNSVTSYNSYFMKKRLQTML